MLVTVISQKNKYSRQPEESATLLLSTSDLASWNFRTRTTQSLLCLWHQNILSVLTQPLPCNDSKRLINDCTKSVTDGFQITYFYVTSNTAMWKWLYNNKYLSVLYKFNGSTHLPGDVRPYPLTWAVAPSYVRLLEPYDGSETGQTWTETIKTHVLMQNIRKEFSYVSLICTIIM